MSNKKHAKRDIIVFVVLLLLSFVSIRNVLGLPEIPIAELPGYLAVHIIIWSITIWAGTKVYKNSKKINRSK